MQAFEGGAELGAITNAVNRFKAKHPGVSVNIAIDPISTGRKDYVTKVLGQFNAGSAADVYGTAIEAFRGFSARGLWLPLNDFVNANPGFSDFAPTLFHRASYKGRIEYIPISWNNIMINYNRDLFDRAAVAYPKDGRWTWDEFRAVAKKLTVKDGSGTVTQFGYEVPNQNFFVQPWFFSNGTSTLNEDWTASNMLDPKVAETLQFLHDLIHVDGVSPIPGNTLLDNQFMAGQVAMISLGHWIVQVAKANNIKMDVAIPPTWSSDTDAIGFGAYAVNKDTAHSDLAKALVLELTSEATQKEEGEKGGGVPGRKSGASTPGFLAFPPRFWDRKQSCTQQRPPAAASRSLAVASAGRGRATDCRSACLTHSSMSSARVAFRSGAPGLARRLHAVVERSDAAHRRPRAWTGSNDRTPTTHAVSSFPRRREGAQWCPSPEAWLSQAK